MRIGRQSIYNFRDIAPGTGMKYPDTINPIKLYNALKSFTSERRRHDPWYFICYGLWVMRCRDKEQYDRLSWIQYEDELREVITHLYKVESYYR